MCWGTNKTSGSGKIGKNGSMMKVKNVDFLPEELRSIGLCFLNEKKLFKVSPGGHDDPQRLGCD